MSQVSRPLQILLVAVLLIGAVYMLALRPKGETGASATPAKPTSHTATSPANGPGASIPGGLGKAVTKARGAAGQSDAANQRVQQATGGGSTTTSSAPASPAHASAATAAARRAATTPRSVHRPVATPGATSSAAAVQTAMASGEVVVLLFWNQKASDDRRVREELTHVSSHGGKVLIVAAPVRQVSLYSASIRGIQVLQSPTVVVIDRMHRARTLVGYTDRAEIGQAVDDALAGR
jgi:hypothetical protein